MSRGDRRGMQLVEQIDELLEKVEHFSDSEAGATAHRLTKTLLELHKEGLARILQLIAKSCNNPQELTARLVEDDWINSLLLIHDLHPNNVEARALRACTQIKPLIASSGGDVDFLDVQNGTVRLRYVTDGTTSLTRTLRQVLEETILAAVPEAGAIQIEEARVLPLPLVE